MIKLWGWMTKEHKFDSRKEQTFELQCPVELFGRISHLFSEYRGLNERVGKLPTTSVYCLG